MPFPLVMLAWAQQAWMVIASAYLPSYQDR